MTFPSFPKVNMKHGAVDIRTFCSGILQPGWKWMAALQIAFSRQLWSSERASPHMRFLLSWRRVCAGDPMAADLVVSGLEHHAQAGQHGRGQLAS